MTTLFWFCIVFMISHAVEKTMAQQCASERSISGWMLQGHVYKTLLADIGLHCLLSCGTDDRCQSFNFVMSSHMCEFSDRTKEATPEDFIRDPDRYYFGKRVNRVPLGSIPELASKSCKEIKMSEKEATSSKYWLSSIKPDIPLFAFCNMTTEDIDECTASLPVCHVSAQCNNTLGSYRCICDPGYTYNGNRCTDINECTALRSACHVNAQCTNTIGSYRCTCDPGYTRNGKTCAVLTTRVQAQTTCSNNLLVQNGNNQSGLIQSSTSLNQQIKEYSANMSCDWTLLANAKLQLVFFGPFITQSNKDFVYVYDGNSSSARLIGGFSGSSRPGPIVSSLNQLYVRFTSDGSSQYEGFKAIYRVLSQGSVRLRGGGLHYGRVEIFYNDQWGTVCDNAWDINDAKVVCRQLGFSRLASNAYTGAHYGQGTGPIWMDDVACSGSESHLNDCRQRGWGPHACTHSKDSSVFCRYGSGNLRLAGDSYYYGRVEVYHNGTWGTVCDDGWGINEAHVVCRQLGFASAFSAPCCAKYGQGSDPIWLDDVKCSGGEASLFDCNHRDWKKHNCGHYEDANVICAIN
ncbi:uncharacterized protein LOC141860089 isoform X3 [Acropora palmata]